MKLRSYSQEQCDVVDRRIRKTTHKLQEAFCFDTARRISLLTGRGAGKTSAELMRMIRAMVRRNRANCLYVAGTRESAERIAWADLKRIVSGLGLSGAKFNESKLKLTLPNGSELFLFGADAIDDIDKLRGLTWHEVAIDECASIKIDILRYLLGEVIGPRMVGTIVLLGTPGKRLEGLFWMVTATGAVGEDKTPQHRPYADRHLPEYAGWIKWSSHQWNITDGVAAGIEAMIEIYHAQLETKAREGWSDTNPIWLREYQGKWIADNSTNVYIYRPYDDAGKEFNQWSPKRTPFGMAILPTEYTDYGYAIGIDVGFKDAFALEVFAWSYSDPSRTLYHVYEIYRTRLYANTIAKLLIGDDLNHDKYGGIVGQIGWPHVMVGDFAGSGGALLEELKAVYGITIKAAEKPLKYKENSVELLNSTFYDGRIKIMAGSNLANELSTLQWVVDAYGKRTENKAQANHACDAALYLRDAVAALLPSAIAEPAPAKPTHRAPAEDIVPQPEISYGGDADNMYASEW